MSSAVTQVSKDAKDNVGKGKRNVANDFTHESCVVCSARKVLGGETQDNGTEAEPMGLLHGWRHDPRRSGLCLHL